MRPGDIVKVKFTGTIKQIIVSQGEKVEVVVEPEWGAVLPIYVPSQFTNMLEDK